MRPTAVRGYRGAEPLRGELGERLLVLVDQGEVGGLLADPDHRRPPVLGPRVVPRRAAAQRRRPFGDTSRVPDHSGAAATLESAARPAVGAASPISDGSTWPGRPA